MPKTEIRRAREDELDALARLLEHVHALHAAHCPTVFTAMDRPTARSWLEESFHDPANGFLIAEVAGQVRGYAYVREASRPATPFGPARLWWEIEHLGVDPEFRRLGIGRGLLRAVLAEAPEQGIPCVELAAWTFNEPAHALFRSMGFDPVLVRYGRSIPKPVPTA